MFEWMCSRCEFGLMPVYEWMAPRMFVWEGCMKWFCEGSSEIVFEDTWHSMVDGNDGNEGWNY